MHYYQFHIGDYKSHTHHLSLMEDLAYRRLLDHYYLHEASIKQRDIARQIGMRDHEQEVLTVLNEFFISAEDGFIHPRADAEIAKFKEFAEAGKRGAAKRWLKGGDGEAISPPNAPPIATINHKPRTNNHIKTIAPPEGVSSEVWDSFVKQRKAKKAPITELVMESIKKQASSAGWTVEQAIHEVVVRNWSTFKADWVDKKVSANQFLGGI
jgi:uncharacterized protein YdaU (DUF1376 family)